jgi:hypothetical protein
MAASDAKRVEAGYANEPTNVVETRTMASSNDGDEVLELVGGAGGQKVEFTEEENRRLLRKIDLRVLPLMCIICEFFVYSGLPDVSMEDGGVR